MLPDYDSCCVFPGGLVDDYRMVRNKSSDGPSCVFTAEKPNYDKSGAVLVPVKKGNFDISLTRTHQAALQSVIN